MQRVGRVHRGGAALDVVNVGALLGDDQRPLELAHVLRVDPEVGLQRHVDLHALRDVDEGAARPHGRVERSELVVVGRDDRRPVLADEVLVLAQRGVHVGEDHALGLELLVDLVVDDLGLVLGADAGEELALGLGDAEAVEGVLDVLGDLGPVAAVAVRGADEVVDVVPVDLVEVAAPLRGRAGEEVVERLEAEVAHPLRLLLVLGDRLDDLAAQALRGLVGIARLRVVEAELLLVIGVDRREIALLGYCFRSCHWSVDLQKDLVVLHGHGKRLHGLKCGERLRPAAGQVEQRPMTGALDGTRRGVELAVGERPVVVGAAILDRIEGAFAVEDADRAPVGPRPGASRPGRARRGRRLR